MGDAAIKRYRRYHGYDYSRGGYIFITTSLSPRTPALGRVVIGRPTAGHHELTAGLSLTPAGAAVEAALVDTPRFVPGVALKQYVIMPDHVHVLVYVSPGLQSPLKSLGRFMAGFKRVAAKNAGITWEKGYHDRICVGADFREQVQAYIEQNPLKWALMYGEGRLTAGHHGLRAGHHGASICHVQEMLDYAVLAPEDYWRGLGNLSLLDGRLCGIRISRRCNGLGGFSARLLRGSTLGYAYISTFLSPGERELWDLLAKNGGKMIKVKERALGLVYRPDINEAPLLAEGRLAILGLGIGRLTAGHHEPTAGHHEPTAGQITRFGSLLLNDKIAAMSKASSEGLALYATPEGVRRI